MGCAMLGGLGLGLAGTGLQMAGQNQSRRAMNDSINQELQRQQGYSNQAQGVFNQSLNQSTPQAAMQQIGQGAQQAGRYQQQAQQPSLGFSLPNFGQANSQQQATRQQNSNQAQAQLQGYSNYGLQQYLKDLQARSQLGVIGSEAAGSAAVNPYEISAASHKGDALQSIGGLLGAGGQVLGLSGLAQGTSGGGSPFGSNGSPIVDGSMGTAPFYQGYPFVSNFMNNPLSTVPPIYGGMGLYNPYG